MHHPHSSVTSSPGYWATLHQPVLCFNAQTSHSAGSTLHVQINPANVSCVMVTQAKEALDTVGVHRLQSHGSQWIVHPAYQLCHKLEQPQTSNTTPSRRYTNENRPKIMPSPSLKFPKEGTTWSAQGYWYWNFLPTGQWLNQISGPNDNETSVLSWPQLLWTHEDPSYWDRNAKEKVFYITNIEYINSIRTPDLYVPICAFWTSYLFISGDLCTIILDLLSKSSCSNSEVKPSASVSQSCRLWWPESRSVRTHLLFLYTLKYSAFQWTQKRAVNLSSFVLRLILTPWHLKLWHTLLWLPII